MLPVLPRLLAGGPRVCRARRHALLSAVGVAAGLLIAGGPAKAAFPGNNGRVTWSRILGNGADVFVMNADGTGLRQLAKTRNFETQADWGPGR